MNPLKLAVITSAIVVAALSTPQESSGALEHFFETNGLSQLTGAYLAKVIFGIHL